MKSFCEGLSTATTVAYVIGKSKKQDLIILGELGGNGILSVLNQKSPFWRFACELKFKDGRMIAKRVIGVD